MDGANRNVHFGLKVGEKKRMKLNAQKMLFCKTGIRMWFAVTANK